MHVRVCARAPRARSLRVWGGPTPPLGGGRGLGGGTRCRRTPVGFAGVPPAAAAGVWYRTSCGYQTPAPAAAGCARSVFLPGTATACLPRLPLLLLLLLLLRVMDTRLSQTPAAPAGSARPFCVPPHHMPAAAGRDPQPPPPPAPPPRPPPPPPPPPAAATRWRRRRSATTRPASWCWCCCPPRARCAGSCSSAPRPRRARAEEHAPPANGPARDPSMPPCPWLTHNLRPPPRPPPPPPQDTYQAVKQAGDSECGVPTQCFVAQKAGVGRSSPPPKGRLQARGGGEGRGGEGGAAPPCALLWLCDMPTNSSARGAWGVPCMVGVGAHTTRARAAVVQRISPTRTTAARARGGGGGAGGRAGRARARRAASCCRSLQVPSLPE